MKVIGNYRYKNSTFAADQIEVYDINHEKATFRWRDKERILKAKIQQTASGRYYFVSRETKVYVDQIQTEDGKLLLAQ